MDYNLDLVNSTGFFDLNAGPAQTPSLGGGALFPPHDFPPGGGDITPLFDLFPNMRIPLPQLVKDLAHSVSKAFDSWQLSQRTLRATIRTARSVLVYMVNNDEEAAASAAPREVLPGLNPEVIVAYMKKFKKLMSRSIPNNTGVQHVGCDDSKEAFKALFNLFKEIGNGGTLIVQRHGDRYTKQPGEHPHAPTLTPLGEERSDAMSQALFEAVSSSRLAVSALGSSPAGRCQRTIKRLAECAQLVIKVDDFLTGAQTYTAQPGNKKALKLVTQIGASLFDNKVDQMAFAFAHGSMRDKLTTSGNSEDHAKAEALITRINFARRVLARLSSVNPNSVRIDNTHDLVLAGISETFMQLFIDRNENNLDPEFVKWMRTREGFWYPQVLDHTALFRSQDNGLVFTYAGFVFKFTLEDLLGLQLVSEDGAPLAES